MGRRTDLGPSLVGRSKSLAHIPGIPDGRRGVPSRRTPSAGAFGRRSKPTRTAELPPLQAHVSPQHTLQQRGVIPHRGEARGRCDRLAAMAPMDAGSRAGDTQSRFLVPEEAVSLLPSIRVSRRHDKIVHDRKRLQQAVELALHLPLRPARHLRGPQRERRLREPRVHLFRPARRAALSDAHAFQECGGFADAPRRGI